MKDPIIILGTGRCGSTLLQRIINTSENITIWGEHAGFLKSLAQSYFVLTESKLMQDNFYLSKNIDKSIVIGGLKDYHKSINWINSFDKQSIKQNYRNLLTNLLNNKLDLDKNTWGFKEILYTKHDRAFDMLLEIFPSCQIIFSIRNPFDVIKSMIISWNNPQTIAEQINNKDRSQLTNLILNYAQRWNNSADSFHYWITNNKINCHIEKYEKLIENPQDAIQQLFNFLSLPIPDNAFKPMTIKVESSHNFLYKTELNKIIYSLNEDIWKVVGKTANFFDYELINSSII